MSMGIPSPVVWLTAFLGFAEAAMASEATGLIEFRSSQRCELELDGYSVGVLPVDVPREFHVPPGEIAAACRTGDLADQIRAQIIAGGTVRVSFFGSSAPPRPAPPPARLVGANDVGNPAKAAEAAGPEVPLTVSVAQQTAAVDESREFPEEIASAADGQPATPPSASAIPREGEWASTLPDPSPVEALPAKASSLPDRATASAVGALKRQVIPSPRLPLESSVDRDSAADALSVAKAPVPLNNPDRLAVLAERNRQAATRFLTQLGAPTTKETVGPLWADVTAAQVVAFLRSYGVDPEVGGLAPELMAGWIERQNVEGDLVNWTVVVRGRDKEGKKLGAANWLPPAAGKAWNLSRTRIAGSNSLGVITTPGDEEYGLTAEELEQAKQKVATGAVKDRNVAARRSRRSSCGLLLLYPISRFSGQDDGGPQGIRDKLFSNPNDGQACDLIGLAVSFPVTKKAGPSEAYLEGTARWQPVLG